MHALSTRAWIVSLRICFTVMTVKGTSAGSAREGVAKSMFAINICRLVS